MTRELARGRENEIELRREEEGEDWRVEKARVKKIERKNENEKVERESEKKVESKKK